MSHRSAPQPNGACFTMTPSRRAVLAGATGAAVATGLTWLAPNATAAPTNRSVGAPLDTIVFGDVASEAAHAFDADHSSAVRGGLDQPARVFHPMEPAGWQGGRATFRMKVAAKGRTYLTIKLWGSDRSPDPEHEWRLQAIVEGEQLGWLDQGPVDNLDIRGQGPRLYNQFYLHTLPLPERLTAGKRDVEVTVQSLGRIWSYGQANNFYYAQDSDSRGVYRLYTHTDPYLVPGADDPFGQHTSAGIRTIDNEAVLMRARARALKDQNDLLTTRNPYTMDGWSWMGLAEGYAWADSPAYRNPVALERVCQAIDGRYVAWLSDDAVLTASDQQWQGFGRVGLALYTLWEDLQPYLDRDVTTAPNTPPLDGISRRDAYRTMLVTSRDYWRQHQRHYSNQAMITSLGIYQANRGLALLSPPDAWPEEVARQWLYEAVGMVPWAGPETASGQKTWPLGHSYFITSPQGLTRELGYVGGYGEVTDWLCMIYQSVISGVGAQPDQALREHILAVVKARQVFRYQGADDDGFATMRLETLVGWRNEEFPGEATYVQKMAWDGHPLEAAAVLDDPELMAWTKKLIDDGQLQDQLALYFSTSLYWRVALNCLHFVARDYPKISASAVVAQPLRMQWGQPDLVFTDQTNGVIAVKRGDEIFYASLYYRARQAINGWARVHLLTPGSDRSATVGQHTEGGTDSTFVVQNWRCWDYAINDSNGGESPIPGGGWEPPGGLLDQAFAGEVMQLAPAPADMDVDLGGTTVGVETLMVGRAPFYVLAYAGYIVLMNTTTDRTFRHQLQRAGVGTDLRTRARVPLHRPIEVGPSSTIVLWAGR